MKRRTRYTREFAARAVKLCEDSNQPVTQVARDLGMEYATLWKWMKKAGKTTPREPALPSRSAIGSVQTPEAMQAEIERLRRELEETRKQLDFAKKAAAFFAQQNK
jgi:transposase